MFGRVRMFEIRVMYLSYFGCFIIKMLCYREYILILRSYLIYEYKVECWFYYF